MIMQKLPFQLLAAAAIAVFAVGCSGGDDSSKTTDSGGKSGATAKTPVKLAFVTNGISDFWKIGEAGIKEAEKEDPAMTVDFKQPPHGDAAEQRQIIDAELATGVQGVAISAKDPDNQTQYFNDVVSKGVPVVTQDSDAPKSNRACYIGTSNVEAGKQAGEAIKKACPNGGKIMLFVGNLDSANSRERKQGIEEALKGSNITIEDTRTDSGKTDVAKKNVADAMVRDPSLVCLVGLYSYNGPAILSAVTDANMVGKVKIVCFDEQAETLAGVKSGAIDATIVQQPFEFGKQAVEMLAKIIRKEPTNIPADKQIIIPTKVIDKTTVDAFKAELDKRLGTKS